MLDTRRLENAMKKRGLKNSGVAKRLGVDRSSVSHWLSGKHSPSSKRLFDLADLLQVSVDYLRGSSEEPVSPDVEFVPVHTGSAVAGSAHGSTVRSAEGSYPFRRHRLREEGIDPENARVFRVVGNSMHPVLPDGSAILVDYDRLTIYDHCIYVYCTDGVLLVKRAKLSEDEWWWCSDNPMGARTKWQETDSVKGEVRWVGYANQATRRLTILDNAESLRDLAGLPSNRLESLSGDRAGQYSIRINRQWRICFRWGDDGPFDAEIVDYHH